MTKKIWVNVTSSIAWNRPAVGIIRTEKKILHELRSIYGERVNCCVWNGTAFEEVTSVAPEKNLDLFKNIKNDPVIENKTLMYTIVSKRIALNLIAQGLLSLTPNRLRPKLNRLFEFLKPRVIVGISKYHNWKLRNKVKSTEQKLFNGPISRDVKSIFNPGDTLISVGLDWDHSFKNELYFLKHKNKIKIISCCYDLIPVRMPQYCVQDVSSYFGSYFLELADYSDLILCISECSRSDLTQFLKQAGAEVPPLAVIRLGDTVVDRNQLQQQPRGATAPDTPFILFVSTIEARKNHRVLYQAYKILYSQGKISTVPKMVFVGMPGWGVADLITDLKLDPEINHKFEILNNISDDELSDLYRRASFCVFPSFYEGWGLPVAEALCHGKLVICSDRGSLPEVGQDLVYYADPYNPHEWADSIYEFSNNEKRLQAAEARIESGYERNEWSGTIQPIVRFIDEAQEKT